MADKEIPQWVHGFILTQVRIMIVFRPTSDENNAEGTHDCLDDSRMVLLPSYFLAIVITPYIHI